MGSPSATAGYTKSLMKQKINRSAHSTTQSDEVLTMGGAPPGVLSPEVGSGDTVRFWGNRVDEQVPRNDGT